MSIKNIRYSCLISQIGIESTFAKIGKLRENIDLDDFRKEFLFKVRSKLENYIF